MFSLEEEENEQQHLRSMALAQSISGHRMPQSNLSHRKITEVAIVKGKVFLILIISSCI